MKPLKPFAYFEPRELAEASTLLLQHGEGARLLAGGTDLLVRMKRGEIRPSAVINLKGIRGLNGIDKRLNGLRIGALTSISSLAESSLLKSECPVLAETARLMGSPSICNLATVGGNIGRASPASDMAPPLMVLNALVDVEGPRGRREIPLEALFAGPGKTTLDPGEVIASFLIPEMPSRSGAAYHKLGRRQGMDLALVGVAVFLKLNGRGETEEARIALSSVGPVPLRSRKAEAELLSGTMSPERIGKAALAAVSDASPISDMRAGADYRKEMIRVLTCRAVEEARQRVQGGKLV